MLDMLNQAFHEACRTVQSQGRYQRRLLAQMETNIEHECDKVQVVMQELDHQLQIASKSQIIRQADTIVQVMERVD